MHYLVLCKFFAHSTQSERDNAKAMLHDFRGKIPGAKPRFLEQDERSGGRDDDLVEVAAFDDLSMLESFRCHPQYLDVRARLAMVVDWHMIRIDPLVFKPPIVRDDFVMLDEESLRRNPDLIFAVARELHSAGLAPGEWFDGEGDYRLHYWKFTRHPKVWVAETLSHPVPRELAERFDQKHKGFDMRAAILDRIVITSPVTLAAFVELLHQRGSDFPLAPF